MYFVLMLCCLTDSQEYSVYNISNTERSVGSKLDQALTAAVQMVERFFANLSTVFMYLEQVSVSMCTLA